MQCASQMYRMSLCHASVHPQFARIKTGAVVNRAALQWTRHMGSLTNSLVLAATVAFAVGLLCASSMDVSTTPAALLRCVLAFALAAAPWSLPLFATARTHLQRQHADCASHLPVLTRLNLKPLKSGKGCRSFCRYRRTNPPPAPACL